MDFKNKNVWITGASSGIGEAFAYAFAKEGANLILSSRRQAELEKVKSNCPPNSKIWIQTLDVADHDSIPLTAKKVLDAVGHIDVLINSAGISQRSLVKDTDFSVIKRIMDINYLGTVAVTKAVLPQMLARKSGKIIAISSLVGKFGTPLRAGYAASKHALHGFFEALQAETFDDNIKITVICPGYIRTQISFNAVEGDGSKHNQMDKGQASGMDVNVFAQKALKAIWKEKREVVIGGTEAYGVLLKRFFPRLFYKIVRKVNTV